MAEAVNAELEKQIPELQDYVKAGIFSRPEIRQIVKRRRGFEYSLRKRQTQKIDFLRYIDYELNVDNLRKVRKEQRRIHLKHTSPSEHAITKRLHFTFKRALLKFKGDMSLWMKYFDFCETSGANKSLGKAFAQALQYLPLESELWIKAASWEWTDNGNPKAARILMQRGLRLNPKSKSLWREYLRLELLFWDKALRRREILGLSTKSNDGSKAFLEGEVPRAVHSAALEKIDGDVDFAIELIAVLQLFDCAGDIMDDAYDNLGDSAKAFAARCERPFVNLAQQSDLSPGDISSSIIEAIENYVNVIEGEEHDSIRGPELASAYAAFARKLLNDDNTASHVIIEKLLSVCRTCRENGYCSPSLYQLWVDIARVTPLVTTDSAIEIVEEAAEATYSINPELAVDFWIMCLEFHMTTKGSTSEEIDSAFNKAIASISSKIDALRLMEYRIQYCLVYRDRVSIESAFNQAISTVSMVGWDIEGNNIIKLDTLKLQYIFWTCAELGLKAARKLYMRQIQSTVPRPSWLLISGLVDLELTHMKATIVQFRNLFEIAIRSDGKASSDLWLRYVEVEAEAGDLSRVNAVYWRAVRTLDNPEEFITKYQLKKLEH